MHTKFGLEASFITLLLYYVFTCYTVTTSFTSAAFGEGTGPIWMSGLTCVGTEITLFSCTSTVPIGSVGPTCTHSNDAAVRCQGLPTSKYSVNNHYISL